MGTRICQTTDGRYVPEGHPDAAFLAYSQHDEPPKEVLEKLEAKSRRKQADKARSKPSDKSAAADQAKD